MKTIFTIILGLGSIVSTSFGAILLQDNFDSYTQGVLTNGTAWPTPIPDTDPALSWTSSSGGPKAIIDGSAAGRSGSNLYSYSENASSNATMNYSSTTLSSAYSGTDDYWVLTLDFYIESMPAGQSSGVFTLVTISNGSAATSANMLSSVFLQRTQSNANLNPGYSYNGTTASFGSPFLTLDTWYTLTITGNNATQKMSIQITGVGYNQTRSDLSYYANHSQFDTVTIGDISANAFVAGRDNQVYLDNLSLITVPEPSVVMLSLLGLACLIGRRRRSP